MTLEVPGSPGAAPAWTRAMRISGLLVAFGLLGGCINDGNSADGGLIRSSLERSVRLRPLCP